MLKLRKYKYLYPKLITNKLYINNKYIIKTYIEFDTLRFYKNQIIDGFDLSEINKFDDLILLTKNFNEKIKITAVDLNTSSEYKKHNNTVRILSINYIDNKINLIVEKIDENYFGYINYFKYSSNIKNDNSVDITPLIEYTKNYKFNISINKKKQNLNINEIINELSKLPKKNSFAIKFNICFLIILHLLLTLLLAYKLFPWRSQK